MSFSATLWRVLHGLLLGCTFIIGSLLPKPARAMPTQVEIPTQDLSSSPAPLVGFLFEPRGASAHAAVVMLHGCGGAYARSGTLNARHLMWGETLAAQGYLALMLDSFTSRGVTQLCTQKFEARTLKERDRVGDAQAALAYLQSRADIDPERIALLGWSHGGGSVLATISSPSVASGTPSKPGYAAAIAFYPGCTSRAKASDSFHPKAPVMILIGEADDWTPVSTCRALTESVAARGEPMHIVTYPGTYHDFDNPGSRSLRVRLDVPNGVHPGHGVTVAPNAEAREDAKKRVIDFLNQTLPNPRP